jgi:hypothetical protein
LLSPENLSITFVNRPHQFVAESMEKTLMGKVNGFQPESGFFNGDDGGNVNAGRLGIYGNQELITPAFDFER